MKYKKIMISTILIFLFSVVSTYGLILPQPISGKVSNIPAGMDVTVIAKNIRSGMQISTKLSGEYYLLEIANMPYGYYDGETIEVKISECEGYDECKKNVQVYGNPIILNFDLATLPRPDIPCDSCCPADTTPYAECDSCCDCLGCEPCPVTIEEYYQTLAAIGVIGAGAVGIYIFKFKLKRGGSPEEEALKKALAGMTDYTGIRVTKWDGKIRFAHLHPRAFGARKSWHDPITEHRKDSHEGGKWVV